MTDSPDNAKPILLKAIEVILANPEDIKRETLDLIQKHRSRSKHASEKEIRRRVVKKIVERYSYFTGFVGGASGMVSIVPGLGQVLSVSGGATADIALTMKFQVEMVMSIAVAHGHDISNKEMQRTCFLVAGVGAINEAAKKGGSYVGSKAFVAMVRQYMKGGVLVATKEVFKRIGVTFTRKALEKAIPFGVGMIVGAGFNTTLTRYIGGRANDFFSIYDDGETESFATD